MKISSNNSLMRNPSIRYVKLEDEHQPLRFGSLDRGNDEEEKKMVTMDIIKVFLVLIQKKIYIR